MMSVKLLRQYNSYSNPTHANPSMQLGSICVLKYTRGGYRSKVPILP